MSPAIDNVTAVMVGTEETRLVVVRGNSASGKSSVAVGLRERICDRNGLPLSVGISAANLHDSQALVPLHPTDPLAPWSQAPPPGQVDAQRARFDQNQLTDRREEARAVALHQRPAAQRVYL